MGGGGRGHCRHVWGVCEFSCSSDMYVEGGCYEGMVSLLVATGRVQITTLEAQVFTIPKKCLLVSKLMNSPELPKCEFSKACYMCMLHSRFNMK